MTDPNRPSDDVVKPAQTGEPVVSKPYIMPDDPEEGSNEALTKELAEARDKMLRTLEKNGVKKFDPSGEKFDPNFQQAMYEVPDPSVPSGTVVQVVQAGFMIGERVLRPALVAVSKGGAKAAPAANNE